MFTKNFVPSEKGKKKNNVTIVICSFEADIHRQFCEHQYIVY